ncbi:iron-sulfur cluster assembly accessory protein [Pelagibacteraceae bacterium]|jgi:iron-sulfur cluster insertion protein|nr:iron-sulfur cluster assembly accessory protein [Pelagibacteraceae bacterium]MDB9743558.1 iron-sulfur cluster assembly accessory protein [Pelagibacteraceae bacterium]MDC0339779.1 iron-sulfur cluster assembly accessory protein [Pelagibacteraceae bacterium]MDC0366624.1 iron-sulfur cluster assembly accessory protein [Pelagibacteraceae bacterium]MDC3232694.1 iron-sulfur cluster assembly accessory protein [Pelagibacteraceae bacterium]|tara:strand:+ start:99 stop:416 length:318 start_codon:yes stop_codon:yes gene_type:complete
MTKKIEFTERARDQIKKIINEDQLKKFFRITVKGGGCSGFKYDFTFDDKTNEDDITFGKAVIDKSSLDIITGSIVDFKKEMIGESFVINNPKATSSCGCGLSFSV